MRKDRKQRHVNDPYGRSVAEVERRQFRFDITHLTDDQKIELIRDLANNTVEWGAWRFTSRAIWVNEDAEHLVAVVKIFVS